VLVEANCVIGAELCRQIVIVLYVPLWAHFIEQAGRQPVTRSQWNASGRPTGDILALSLERCQEYN